MKFNEKILYCRKKAGLSQEELAEKLGVSRQAISKWENGDSTPEISKLFLIAKTFGVSTDWLLSEDSVEDEYKKENDKTFESNAYTSQHAQGGDSWLDSIPGFIGRMLRRYGWLFGVYLAIIGTGLICMGGLARYMVRRMFSHSISDFMGGMFFGDSSFQTEIGMDSFFNGFGGHMNDAFLSISQNNPVYIMGTAFVILGFIMLIAGIITAVILKKKSK